MPGPVFIDGDRIELRTIEREDLEFLQRGVNHPEVRRYISMFRTPYNEDRYEEDMFDRFDSGEDPSLLICVDGEPVGSISLLPVHEDRGDANLGLWLLPEFHGEGYASEAVELMVAYGFRQLRLHRISAFAMAPNDASRRMLERAGFTEEGRKREASFVDGEYVDDVVYGLLRREWADAA